MAEKFPKMPEYDPSKTLIPISEPEPFPNPRLKSNNPDPLLIVAVIIIAVVIVGGVLAVALIRTGGQAPPVTGPILTLSVNSASWEYLNDNDYRTYDGNLFLWVSVTLANIGTENITVFTWDFELQDLAGVTYNSTNFNSGGDVIAGGHLDMILIFDVPPGCGPSMIIFDSYFLTATSAAVPTPAALQPDVVIGSIDAHWHLDDPDGIVTYPGKIFLWLTFDMENRWSKSIDLILLGFNVTGDDGSTGFVWKIEAPATLAPGSTDGVRLILWVDVDFMPNILNYQDFSGPYTSASVPDPTWA